MFNHVVITGVRLALEHNNGCNGFTLHLVEDE